MNTSPPPSTTTKSVRKTWPAWALFVVSLLVTVFVSLEVKQRIEIAAVKQVGFAYDQATLRIQERLHIYAQILRGSGGLFAASDTVSRAAWRAYVEKLHTEESVPGVQGIGFAQVISPGQLDAHIKRIRQGFPNYTVRPPGERAIMTSIVFLEPFRDRNLRAFGYDMFSESVRRAALVQARDSGTVALSGKVELVQETARDVQAGTLMYVPVYRNGAPVDTVEERQAALLGWTYSPYRMNDLMGGILRQWEHDEGQSIDLQIYDGAQALPAALLFDSKPVHEPGANSLFFQKRSIDFGGRQWLLVFDYQVSSASLNYANAWVVLIGGLVLSSLLLGLVLLIINTRTSAERIAAGLVATIVEREALLEQQTHILIRTNAELTRLSEVMAHHFQEPARRLASFAQRLLKKSALANDADSRQSLEFIDQQARRLSELVRDAQHYLALDHTKVGAGETADSQAVLRQAVAKNADAAQAEIAIKGILPKLRLEATRLSEVFAILLDNALRYRDPQRPLHIEVGASVSGKRAVFRFADNGSGIAPEYRAQVFELFTRLVPNSVPGTGVGLALVRKIVQQAGGDVSVEDGIDGGACIVFDLPLETDLCTDARN